MALRSKQTLASVVIHNETKQEDKIGRQERKKKKKEDYTVYVTYTQPNVQCTVR